MSRPPVRHFHPWHDIPAGSSPPDQVTAVIEIPTNERNKYELDKEIGMFRLDRVLYSAVHYPGDYGFIPRTLGDDGDPLDILVLMQEPVEPLTIVRARALGGLRMTDDKGGDDKIVAVCIDDPAVAHYTAITELPPHVMRELERFFRDYKMLENKMSEVGELYDQAEALAVIQRSRDAYERGEH